MRIVSLLPSATEIICSLGLREQLVGVSHECDFPPGVADLPRVTRSAIDSHQSSREIDAQVRDQLTASKALYSLNEPLLRSLEPDLFITQALCDVCAVSADEVDDVAGRLPGEPRVINLEPSSLGDVFATISDIAESTGVEAAATDLIGRLQDRIQCVRERVRATARQAPRVAFLEWIDPLFNAGHWTPELVELAGAVDVTGSKGQPSRTFSWRELVAAEPEVLVIGCCGYSIKRTLEDMPILTSRPEWARLPCTRTDQVFVADGNHYFNRPGPRLVDSLELLAAALLKDVDLPPGVIQFSSDAA